MMPVVENRDPGDEDDEEWMKRFICAAVASRLAEDHVRPVLIIESVVGGRLPLEPRP
jgi:hypothetical protein